LALANQTAETVGDGIVITRSVIKELIKNQCSGVAAASPVF
jgi:hypothetical protein